jgi:prepilin-type N-terminal cleavage/methylation domain-containing protein
MKTSRSGFTLVELSIVLIIIGLIISGVVKGQDLINSAKQKKFYNTFVKGWQIAIEQYQDRTGQILGDSIANGGNQQSTDGLQDIIDLSSTTTVQTQLKTIGLDVPITSTGNSGTYRVEGKYYTNTVRAFLSNQLVDGGYHNVFLLYGVPTDVALALDTMIDGTADATSGNCRQNPGNNLQAGTAVTPWPDASKTLTTNVTILL